MQRILKPEYLVNREGFQSNQKIDTEQDTLFDEEIERAHRELGEALEQQRKERWNYLIEIERTQNFRDDRPWPYDLCKMAGDSEEVLQWARKYDHLFDYKRENPKYEYDPKNYENIKYLTKYDYTYDLKSEDSYDEISYDEKDYEFQNYDDEENDIIIPEYNNFKSFINDFGQDEINSNEEEWHHVTKKTRN